MIRTNVKKNRCLPLCFMVIVLLVSTNSLANNSYVVKAGDSVEKVANKFYKSTKITKNQLILGILSENPTAFSRGNINTLILGNSLKLPDEKNLVVYPESQANRIVRQHLEYAKKGIKKQLKLPQVIVSKTPEELLQDQKKQSEQLEKLQSESQQLQARLDQLIIINRKKDKQLEKIENTLENMSQSSSNK